MSTTLAIVDGQSLLLRSVSVKTERSQTALESVALDELDQTWYDMTEALMTDFDQQMSSEISAIFRRLLPVACGGTSVPASRSRCCFGAFGRLLADFIKSAETNKLAV